MKVIVSDRAEAKLHQTADYILREFGPRSKSEFFNEFKISIIYLRNNPYMWPIEPLLSNFSSTYRSFVLKRFNKVIYRIVDDHIEISDIWDCRRNPDTLVSQMK